MATASVTWTYLKRPQLDGPVSGAIDRLSILSERPPSFSLDFQITAMVVKQHKYEKI